MALRTASASSTGWLTQPAPVPPENLMPVAGVRAVPMFRELGNTPLRQIFRPMEHATHAMLSASQAAIRLRLKAQHNMAQRPLQIVPIPCSIPINGNIIVQVRNPYLGNSSGMAVMGEYKAPWSVTAFRTSNNESGQLQGIRIPSWIIGGHEYVTAALGGLTHRV